MKKFIQTKLIIITAVVALFAGCEVADQNTAVSQNSVAGIEVTKAVDSSVNVALIKAYSYVNAYQGMPGGSRNYWILVKNIAYEKKVVIYGKTSTGEWADLVSAQYQESVADNYEIWFASLDQKSVNAFGNQFVVRYEVAGSVYYDNNYGNNYTQGGHDGPLFGNLNVVKADYCYASVYEEGYFYGDVDVKNLGYAKKVTIVYTTDDWATNNSVDAVYAGDYIISYGETIPAPNTNNIEPWHFSVAAIPSTTKMVKYAVKYEVNNQTYWDNNFGANYTITVTK